MKPFLLLFMVLFFLAPCIFPDFQDILSRADLLYDQESYLECKSYLLKSLDQAAEKEEKAELYWRLARAVLKLGDQAKNRGASKEEVRQIFEEGEELAQKAIGLDPYNHLGYYWKSVNIGRLAQVRGVLNALAQVKSMKVVLQKALSVKPDHAKSFYVLGRIYETLPGRPLSFGNKDYAVSLGRKAVGLHTRQVQAGVEKETEYDFFTELAKHLYKRNWAASKRYKEQEKKRSKYQAKTDILEKNLYYEGVVKIKNISDREEARELIAWVIRELMAMSKKNNVQELDLQEALEAQARWK